MEKRIFLYPADLMILTGKAYKTCWRNYRTLADSLGKKKGKHITLKEYSQLEEVPIEEIKLALNIA